MFFTEDLVPWAGAGVPDPGRVDFVAGCDAISVFSVGTSEAVYRGFGYPSPARLAAAPDMRLVLASQSGGDPPLVMALTLAGEPELRWSSGWIQLDDLATLGGIAVLPTGDAFLAATARHPWRDAGPIVTKNAPPYFVRKFGVPRLAPAPAISRLRPPLGSIELDGVAVEILLGDNGRLAHILTDVDTVHTIDTNTMLEVAAPVDLAPYVGSPGNLHQTPVIFLQAALSCDGRFLIGNRGELGQLRVADLVERRAWTLDVEPDVERIGGVAINCGWLNRGLLALHAVNEIQILRFATHGPLEMVSRTPIRPPRVFGLAQDTGGPVASISWSGSGSRVIAATDVDRSEFVSYRVADAGATLSEPVYMAACQRAGRNFANDILTANGTAAPRLTPSPTPLTTKTATSTATSTPTPTQTVARTELPTETPTTRPTAVRSPVPVYLPLALREHCTPGTQRVDVALVIDASTTMRRDLTSAGRTKLDAAIDAAVYFVGTMSLPQDQAAVVAFNDTAEATQPLTGRRADIEAALRRLPQLVRQQTRIDLGVAKAHEELTGARRNPANDPVLILLTDGLANPVPASVAVQRADSAKADHITIFTIGLGQPAELNLVELERMASRPDYFYLAPDGEDLQRIYRTIAVEIPCPASQYWGRR